MEQSEIKQGYSWTTTLDFSKKPVLHNAHIKAYRRDLFYIEIEYPFEYLAWAELKIKD